MAKSANLIMARHIRFVLATAAAVLCWLLFMGDDGRSRAPPNSDIVQDMQRTLISATGTALRILALPLLEEWTLPSLDEVLLQVINLAHLLLCLGLSFHLVLILREEILSYFPEPAPVAPFRSLDLPPELRNKIYVFASQAAFEAPLSIAWTPPEQALLDPDKNTLYQLEHNKKILSQKKRVEVRPKRRPAILLTNRQIYNEASRIYFQSMTLDLDFCYLPSSLHKIMAFANKFETRLQFIRHIEMELRVAELVLFRPADVRDVSVRKLYGCTANTSFYLSSLCTQLSNVESVTIYPDRRPNCVFFEDKWDYGVRQRVAYPVLKRLGHRKYRERLSEVFPRVRDIVASNDFGCERYRKGETDRWELHYAREVLPLQRWKGGDVAEYLDELFDGETRLTVATTFDWIGDRPMA